jgi:outer membrane receptor protein involved in Fe transport
MLAAIEKSARRTGATLICSATIVMLLSGGRDGTSHAQEAEARTPLDEVIVTGTRIRRDDFNAPTPTTILDSEDLQSLGIVNIGDAMAELPQNVNTNSPTVAPGGAFFAGASLANLRGLNPFFGSRSLTLVDSRRHVPTNQSDGVDLNFIPTIIVDRMEVVTGGASASYGSGAISGVTNLLLDRDMEGIRAQVDISQTEAGDGDDAYAGLAFGMPIMHSGHFVFGVEDQVLDPITDCTARDWCAQGYGTIVNPAFVDNVNPQNVRIAGLHRGYWNSPNGIFYIPRYNGRVPNTDTIVPLEVTASGTGLQDWQTGAWGDGPINALTQAVGGNVFTTLAIGGSGQNIYEDAMMRTEVDRTSAYFAFTYDLSSRLGFFFDGSGGSVEAWSPGQVANAACMRADYAYLPQNPAAQALFAVPANLNCRAGVVPPQPFNGILIKKNWTNQVDAYNLATTDLVRAAFGFDGQIGESTWTWDAYYQYGKSERMQHINDLLTVTRYNLAFDAVLDASGNPVCRSIRDNTLPPGFPPADAAALRNGCTPINIFGQAPLSPSVKSYAFGFVREDTTVEQEIVEATASGEVLDGFGAGPVRLALGVSYRTESIANLAAEELGDALRRDLAVQYGDSFSGDVDVAEYFAELDLPVLERFGFNVAARNSNYTSTAGAGTGIEGQDFEYDLDTWKVSGAWGIIDALQLRFSRSRDARAPNFRELYFRQTFPPDAFTCGILTNPPTNPWTNSIDRCAVDFRGGLELVPEKSDTTTLGFVLAPPALPLRFAIDYYEIAIEGAITPGNTFFVLDSCNRGVRELCNQITGTTQPFYNTNNQVPCPATCFSDIQTLVTKAYNFRRYDYSGIDFSADWIRPLASGSVQLRFLASRTLHQRLQPNAANPSLIEDIVGVTGAPTAPFSDFAAAADLTANLIATWSRDNFSITGQVRYVDDGINDLAHVGPDDPRYDITVVPGPGADQTVNVNTVPSYDVYTLSGAYDFALAGGNRLQFYGLINNLLDEDPPLVARSSGVGGTQPQFFDTLGRTYRLGLRMRF